MGVSLEVLPDKDSPTGNAAAQTTCPKRQKGAVVRKIAGSRVRKMVQPFLASRLTQKQGTTLMSL